MADPTPRQGTEVPAGGHNAFPPFDKQTFPSQLLWLTLTFLALYLLMSRIALPRVAAILKRRQQSIESDLADAQRLKGKSDEAIAAYEKALADARGRAQALVNEARQQQTAEAEGRRKTLDASLNDRIAAAEKSIARTKSAALDNLRGIATEAAGAIIERLVGRPPASQEAVAGAVADVLKH
jgi:F-type H+-transporting ATPase subunit b